MNARITLFAALVSLTLFAGCGKCCKAKKIETAETENVLDLNGIAESTETAKEDLTSEEV